MPHMAMLGELPRQICDRLVELEVSVPGMAQWLKLLGIELFQSRAGGRRTKRATSSKGYRVRRETCKVTCVFLAAPRALLSMRAKCRCVPLHHARPPRFKGQANSRRVDRDLRWGLNHAESEGQG